ncbi:MAG: penicillin-binding transpeptidase domain-containing protein [Clostridia bacterium]|nr:penicillin-binding transpeptidase domain-containing protein [Clostridia bacterium]
MKNRVIIVMFSFAFLFLLVLGKLFYLQVVDGIYSGKDLAQKALKIRSQCMSGEEYYRGEILDKNLLSITDSGIRPTLVAFPSSINNVEETSKQLEQILRLPAKKTLMNIKRSKETYGNRMPLILKANLSSEDIKKCYSNMISGIAIIPVKTRYGPNSLAKHLVGYLNSIDVACWKKLSQEKKTVETNEFLASAYKITDKIGVAGLEKEYENVLKGAYSENEIIGIADANGKLIEGLGYKSKKGKIDGWRNHLVLTLDRQCQEIVEMVMDKDINRGAVVVLDIPSGNVLALASRPDFNQNAMGSCISGIDELIDRTERVAFYPGSVFKMVVAAGVLEENLVLPGEVFTCTGAYVFPDDTKINCSHEHGEINLKEAIIKSCNSTFIQLGLRLGSTRLQNYAKKLGFTIKVDDQSPLALVGNASIGQQGVLVSPLQIVNLYATIARNGIYRPYQIISQIRNSQGEIIQDFPNRISTRVLKVSTCNILKEALAKATSDGTGRKAWLEGIGSAGKTGTAQININGKVIAWFVGFAPLEEPRIAIAVMVEENKSGVSKGLTGGDIAAPMFKEIAQKILELDDYGNYFFCN